MSNIIFDETSSTVAAWAAIWCSVLGLVGNGLTMVVLYRTKDHRFQSITPLVICLALSDFLFCGFSLPLTAARFFLREQTLEIFGENLCQFFPIIFYSNTVVSVMTLAIIAVNRYVGLFHSHITEEIFSKWKSVIYILAIWIFSLGIYCYLRKVRNVH